MALPNMAMIPSGYKPTKLYSVLPTPENGSEEVTNGDFATDSDWSKGTGWTISGGSANSAGSNEDAYLSQVTFVVGKTYKVTFDISSYTSGSLSVRAANEANVLLASSVGSYAAYITPISSVSVGFRSALGGFIGSIDNVSVKEVIASDADFTVTRASSATRVNEQGLIETPEFIIGDDKVTNGDFATDTDWTKGTGITISGGKANFTGNANTALTQSGVVSSNKTYKATFTVSNYVSGAIDINLGGSTRQGNISANGTYAFYATVPSGHVLFFQEDFSNGFIGSIDNVSVVQVERENIPRIDYTDGGCPVLLTEPQSTNLITESEDFSDSSWLKESGGTIALNTEISPTGSLNASYLQASIGTDLLPRIYYSFTSVASTSYVGSVFVKKDNIDWIRLLSTGATASTLQAYYNVSNGTLGTQGTPSKAKIEDYGNGWYRLSLVIGAVNSTSSATFRIQLTKSDGGSISDFNGTEKNIIFGAQLENLPYPTSYMPTYGEIASRASETVSNAGDVNTFNSTEGVLFVEVAALANEAVNKRITISDGTLTNRITINISTDQISGFVNVNSVTQYTFFEASQSVLDLNKIAIKYKGNDFAVWINGVQYDVSTSGTTFPLNTLTTLRLDNGLGGEFFYGKTSQVQVFNTALSDFELKLLTGGDANYDSYEAMRLALNYNIQ